MKLKTQITDKPKPIQYNFNRWVLESGWIRYPNHIRTKFWTFTSSPAAIKQLTLQKKNLDRFIKPHWAMCRIPSIIQCHHVIFKPLFQGLSSGWEASFINSFMPLDRLFPSQPITLLRRMLTLKWMNSSVTLSSKRVEASDRWRIASTFGVFSRPEDRAWEVREPHISSCTYLYCDMTVKPTPSSTTSFYLKSYLHYNDKTPSVSLDGYNQASSWNSSSSN